MKYLTKYNEAKKQNDELEQKSREIFNKIKDILNVNLNTIKNDTKDLMADVIDEYELRESDIYTYIYIFNPDTKPDVYERISGSLNDFAFNLDYAEYKDAFNKPKYFYEELKSLYDYLISPMEYVVVLEVDIRYLIPTKDNRVGEYLGVYKRVGRDLICNTADMIPHDHHMKKLEKLTKFETDVMKIAPMTNSTCSSDFSMIKIQYTYEYRIIIELFYQIDIVREKDWINVIPEEKRNKFIEFCRSKKLNTSDIKELINLLK